jgi:hypothetical protein
MSSCNIAVDYSTNDEVRAAEEKLIADLEKTCEDEMNTMANQQEVMEGFNSIDSSGDAAFISMILLLVQECGSIAGAISITADFMTVISDIVELVTIAENEVGLLYEQADASTSSTDVTSGSMTTEEADEMQGFVDAVDFLINQDFKVTVVADDGSQTTKSYTNGLLEYLGDDTSGIWPGPSPMGDSTDLVRTSAEDIEDQFGSDWGNINKMWSNGTSGILYWANPITSQIGDETIESYSPQYSKIMDDFQQINDQTDMQVQTVQYETQQLTTMYQQYQNLTYEIMQSLAKMNMCMVTNQGK